KAGRGRTVQAKESAQRRIVHIDQAPGLVPDIREKVGGEIDRERGREGTAPLVVDPERRADPRVSAVCRDQVLTTDLVQTPIARLADRQADSRRVLMYVDNLGPLHDGRSPGAGAI